ncbi:cytosine permease [Pelotomaculum schinkii]|uniref:Cytosine permease n=1 Tax=Pelotomaculum schinkii TaxID=78350 RepID=A0A4Y7R8W4_9FIRM|nr:putative hydroxymethylpyrimidine transporter CytX [Pelotomaculum schinkii]TEB05237.1 cytosine permease [Pelotomaculum schinkii]
MGKEGTLGGLNQFALWFGAAVSLAEIMTGSLIAPLGIKEGIAVILAGHLIGTLILALVGVIGFREKSPSLKSSRLSLGRYGSYIISVFNIIQLVGWTAIMLIQCTRSLQSITGKLFGFDNFTVLVIAIGILVGIWAFNAHRGINLINNVAVVLLLLLCVLMLRSVLQAGEAQEFASSITFGAALELSIIMPLTWLPLISDYTMLGKSRAGSFWGSFGGYFLGSSFMYIIGLLSATYAGTPDPIGVMAGLNLGISAVFIVILSTVTTTFLDVYSAVMSTSNISPGVSRKNLILIFTALGTLLAMFFPMEQYENFLYMIGSLFAPIFTIVLMDYFIYKDNRSMDAFNITGFVAAITGVITYYAVTGMDLLIGSTIPAMTVTMVVYGLIRLISKYLVLKGDKYAKQNC